MIYFQIKNSDGKIISENMELFSDKEKIEKNKNFFDYKNGIGIKSVEESFSDNMSIWFVAKDDDLLKSSQLFKKTLNIYKQVTLDSWKYYRLQIDSYSHTIATIQIQIRQKLEGFAADEKFYGDSHADSLNNISEVISNNIGSASDLICYIHKRISDLRAHLLGTDVICAGNNFELKLTKVSLKRAILNQVTPFLNQFDENSIKLKIFFDDSDEVSVDKNMFSLVMYNFFSNAVKYAKPGSEIRMNYIKEQSCLDISMISLKMEKSEIKNLFNDGTRGAHAKEMPGKGIGLFVLKRALELMKKDNMFIDPNYSNGNSWYVENHFKFIL